MKSIPLS